MAGTVTIEEVNSRHYRVTTSLNLIRLEGKFYRPLVRKPFDQALGYGARLAAELGFSLEDKTGLIPPEICTELVKECAAKLARPPLP